MKKEFLTNLGITDSDVLDKIMAEQGRDIQREQAKFADYADIKEQLKKANEKIESFGDVDAIKSEVEKYKTDIANMQKESELKIKKLERQGKIKDYISGKKYINDLTREGIFNKLESALEDEKNKDKSLDDVYKDLTKDMKGIYAEEKPSQQIVVPPMQNKPASDDNAIRRIMGLPIK